MTGVFDEAVFGALRAELGDADTGEALTEFLADTEGKMTLLAASGEARGVVRIEAHSIKSSAGMFGFEDVSRIARELEEGSQTLPPAELSASIAQLRQAFEQASEFARAHLLKAA